MEAANPVAAAGDPDELAPVAVPEPDAPVEVATAEPLTGIVLAPVAPAAEQPPKAEQI